MSGDTEAEKHGLKSSQDLLLIILAQHVRKLSNLFALLGATYEFFAHDRKPHFLDFRVLLNHGFYRTVIQFKWSIVLKGYTTKFI